MHFSMNSRSSGQPKIDAKTPSTLHPLSPVFFATAIVVAFVLLRNSRFSFHCYTQREATLTQKSAQKRRCDFSRLLARKITKGIKSCKPASLNRPTAVVAKVYPIHQLLLDRLQLPLCRFLQHYNSSWTHICHPL